MDKKLYLTKLYDYYSNLLTDKQKMYFEDYYWNDLSLSEIAENNNISRNAIHNQLKLIEERLDEIENALKLLNKKEEINSLLKNKIDSTLFDKVNEIL